MLTMWHCPHAEPTAANLQQQLAVAEWDKQTDGRTDRHLTDA